MKSTEGLVYLLNHPDSPETLAVKHYLAHRMPTQCKECDTGLAVFRKYLWGIEPGPEVKDDSQQ